MATFLYRLGRLSFRRRRIVVMLWVAFLAAIGIGAMSAPGTSSGALSVPGTQSQRAIDLLQKEFPQASADGATARVVFEAPNGQKLTSAANKAEVESLVAKLERSPQVSGVTDPFSSGLVSRSGSIAYTQVSYKVAQADVSDAAHTVQTDVVQQGEKAGLKVSLGGNAVKDKATNKAAELIGVGVAAVVLVITFGSMIAAGLPLLTAILGVVAAVLSVTLTTHFFDLASASTTLALMLGLAVAIDYALFIVSRYRNEIRDGHEPEEACGRALGTAGSAVVFAGLTVIVALSGLSVIGIGMLTSMGLTSAFAVAVAVVIALTLLPALLGFAGMRIMKGRMLTRRMKALERGEGESMGVRWARFVTRNPVKVLAVSVAALALLAIPAMSLRMALNDDSGKPPGTTQRIAYDTLSKGFGPGFNGPLTPGRPRVGPPGRNPHRALEARQAARPTAAFSRGSAPGSDGAGRGGGRAQVRTAADPEPLAAVRSRESGRPRSAFSPGRRPSVHSPGTGERLACTAKGTDLDPHDPTGFPARPAPPRSARAARGADDR